MIQDFIDKEMIGKSDRSQELYILNVVKLPMLHMDDSLQTSDSSTLVNKVSVEVWHHRLGHLSSKILIC